MEGGKMNKKTRVPQEDQNGNPILLGMGGWEKGRGDGIVWVFVRMLLACYSPASRVAPVDPIFSHDQKPSCSCSQVLMHS